MVIFTLNSMMTLIRIFFIHIRTIQWINFDDLLILIESIKSIKCLILRFLNFISARNCTFLCINILFNSNESLSFNLFLFDLFIVSIVLFFSLSKLNKTWISFWSILNDVCVVISPVVAVSVCTDWSIWLDCFRCCIDSITKQILCLSIGFVKSKREYWIDVCRCECEMHISRSRE